MLKLLLSISVLRKVRLGIFKVPIWLVPMKTHSSTWHIVDAHYMLVEWSSFSYGEQGLMAFTVLLSLAWVNPAEKSIRLGLITFSWTGLGRACGAVLRNYRANVHGHPL